MRTTMLRSTTIRWLLLSAAAAFLGLGVFACQRPEPAPQSKPTADSITGIEWVVVEVDGQAAAPGTGGKPATLTFTQEGSRATGFAGCNRFSGDYQREGDQLRFAPILMTKMACDQGMDLERSLGAALEATRSTRATPAQLELLDETGAVRVRLSRPGP